MKTILTVFGAGAAAAALALGLAGSAGATMPKTLSITTSGKGGSWFAVGSRVIREVEKANPGLVTQVQTGGGLTNLRKIQAGQADIGMTFAFAAPMAYNAVAPFKKKHDKLTYLGVLFPGYLQIVTKKASNIKKFEDLFDKRISAGKIGWGGELMFRLMLNVYGMDYDKIPRQGRRHQPCRHRAIDPDDARRQHGRHRQRRQPAEPSQVRRTGADDEDRPAVDR